jgi:ribonuclease D
LIIGELTRGRNAGRSTDKKKLAGQWSARKRFAEARRFARRQIVTREQIVTVFQNRPVSKTGNWSISENNSAATTTATGRAMAA